MILGILIRKKRLRRHVQSVVELVAVRPAHQVNVEIWNIRLDSYMVRLETVVCLISG